MKRFVLSVVATGSLAMSSLFAAGPAFASEGGDHPGNDKGNSSQTSTVCSNGGLLQLQLVCVGSIAVPIALSILSGDNFFTNESLASNKNSAKS
jgi:hypothetical protein